LIHGIRIVVTVSAAMNLSRAKPRRLGKGQKTARLRRGCHGNSRKGLAREGFSAYRLITWGEWQND
jgi:hypothetical protein